VLPAAGLARWGMQTQRELPNWCAVSGGFCRGVRRQGLDIACRSHFCQDQNISIGLVFAAQVLAIVACRVASSWWMRRDPALAPNPGFPRPGLGRQVGSKLRADTGRLAPSEPALAADSRAPLAPAVRNCAPRLAARHIYRHRDAARRAPRRRGCG
jgi:hypothetical protein